MVTRRRLDGRRPSRRRGFRRLVAETGENIVLGLFLDLGNPPQLSTAHFRGFDLSGGHGDNGLEFGFLGLG